MAKNNEKNNDITANELLSKLGKEPATGKAELKPEAANTPVIDVTNFAEKHSESDLDINELLRKYLPEFEEEESNLSNSVKDGVWTDTEKEVESILSELGYNGETFGVAPSESDGKVTAMDNSDICSDDYSGEDQSDELPEEKADENDSFLDALFVSPNATEDPTMSAAETVVEATEAETVAPVHNSPFAEGIFEEYEIPSEELPQEAAEEMTAEPEEATEDLNAEEVAAENENSRKTRSFLDGLLGRHTHIKEEIESDTLTQEEGMAETYEEIQDDTYAEEAVTDVTDEQDEIGLNDSLFTKAEETEETISVPDGEANEENPENASDPTDINLMIAFDMDAKDEQTAQKAKELGDKLENKTERQQKKFVLDHPEYVDKTQAPVIAKEYKKKRRSLKIRTLLCALFTIVLFAYENLPTVTKLFTGEAQQFAGAIDPALYPVVYIMVSLQIMLFACLCALPEIMRGFKSLFSGVPRPESMLSVLTVAGILYAAVLSNLIKSPNEPVMFGAVVALSALFTLIGAGFNLKREMMNFRIVSSRKTKNIVRRMEEEESENETKAFAGESEEICDVMKIEKTNFVNNFFTRLEMPDQTTGSTMTFLMSVAIAAGVLFGIFTSFRSGADSAFAWRAVFASMYVIAPMTVFLAYSYPFYRANRAAKEYDSAIIGEAALEEYSNASIISFDDKSVFPSYAVKVQNIRIYNNARIDRVLYYASSVFAYAGGPLQDVFELATKDMGISERVQIFDAEPGFLATQVDGVNIIFGAYDALTSRNLEIPENAAEDDVDLSDELQIMYMFRENKLVAKMYIKYDMDEDIDSILKQFAGEGLYVCVRTFDPNIDESMITKKLNMKRMPLKIIRYADQGDVHTTHEKADSGLVTCSSPKSLLQVISYCEKVIHTKKTNTALSVLSVMIGAAILLLLLLSDSMSILTSLLIAVYQLVWMIPTVISSKVFIR